MRPFLLVRRSTQKLYSSLSSSQPSSSGSSDISLDDSPKKPRNVAPSIAFRNEGSQPPPRTPMRRILKAPFHVRPSSIRLQPSEPQSPPSEPQSSPSLPSPLPSAPPLPLSLPVFSFAARPLSPSPLHQFAERPLSPSPLHQFVPQSPSPSPPAPMAADLPSLSPSQHRPVSPFSSPSLSPPPSQHRPVSPFPSLSPSPSLGFPQSPPPLSSSSSDRSDISLDMSPKKHSQPVIPTTQAPAKPSTPSDVYEPSVGTPAPSEREPEFPENLSMAGEYQYSIPDISNT